MNRLTTQLRKIATAGVAILFAALCIAPIVRPPEPAQAATSGATVRFEVRMHNDKPWLAKSVVLGVPAPNNTNDIDMGDCASETRRLLVEAGSPLICHNMVFRNYNPNFPSTEVSVSPGHKWAYAFTNNTNGTIVSEKLGRPIMNFSSGNATIYIDLTASPTNTYSPPSLSATAVTDDSITLSWTPGVFPKDSPYWYSIYSNSKKTTRTIKDGATTTRFDGLQPCTVYRMLLNSAAGGSNIASVRTTGCAAPTPPRASTSPGSSATPTRTASGSSHGVAYDWGGDSYYDSKANGASSKPTKDGKVTPPVKADETPAMPAYFTALGTKGNSAVSLTWGVSFGNSKIHYMLERSSDKNDWKVLRDDIVSNAYNDFTAEFGALYYYRLTAIDSDGHYSPSVVVSYNADDFQANVGNGKTLHLTSKDKFLQLTIPSDSLPADANCSFAQATPDLPLVGSKEQKVIGGPYKVVCQQKDGSLAQTFSSPVAVKATLSDTMARKYGDVSFQAYSATTNSWHPVEVKQDKRTVELSSDDMALVALARPKGTPLWLTALIVVVIGGAIVASGVLGTRSALRLLNKRQAETAEDDYWHKMNGV